MEITNITLNNKMMMKSSLSSFKDTIQRGVLSGAGILK